MPAFSGVPIVATVYDETSNESNGIEECSFQHPHVVAADVRADQFSLKIGTFAVEMDGFGKGPVLIDGQPIRCRKFSVNWNVRGVPEVMVEFYPMPTKREG